MRKKTFKIGKPVRMIIMVSISAREIIMEKFDRHGDLMRSGIVETKDEHAEHDCFQYLREITENEPYHTEAIVSWIDNIVGFK
jgi:hypothetical protein